MVGGREEPRERSKRWGLIVLVSRLVVSVRIESVGSEELVVQLISSQ